MTDGRLLDFLCRDWVPFVMMIICSVVWLGNKVNNQEMTANSLKLLPSSVIFILDISAWRGELQPHHLQVQLWLENSFFKQLYMSSDCRCKLLKGVSSNSVILLIFQAILSIEVKFNFLKKLNRSYRVCLNTVGSSQPHSEDSAAGWIPRPALFPSSISAALWINRRKQIWFTIFQKTT